MFFLVWQETKVVEGKKKRVPKRRSLRTKVRSEAEAELREVLRSGQVTRPTGEDLTLHEAADAFLRDRSSDLRAFLSGP